MSHPASHEPPTLPGFIAEQFPFRRRVHELTRGADSGRRLHFVDEGDEGVRPVLLVHGNPTWSFLWRRVIARLEGLRAVAPDLLGLGLSDRLPRIEDHTPDRHADALAALVEALDLRDIILVGQDWGGPIATAAAARLPDRVTALVLANTAVIIPRNPRGTSFHRFARMPVVSDLVFRGLGFPQIALHRAQADPSSIRGPIARAYRWPLRTWRDRVAPLAMARMVPDTPTHPSMPALRRAERWVLSFQGPTALVWGTRDPILGRALKRHEKALPNATITRTEAGHFLQEEVPDEIAAAIREVAAAT